MTEKIIDEVMGLVSVLWKSGVSRETIDTQCQKYEAIRAKLREVLERKPLTEEQICEINSKSNVPSRRPEYVTDCWGDEKTIWHETTAFSFPLFARNIERAHNIK